jgi:hypothetical protein
MIRSCLSELHKHRNNCSQRITYIGWYYDEKLETMTIHSKQGNADAKKVTQPLSKIDPGSRLKTVQAKLSRSAKFRTHPLPVMCWISHGINSITFTLPAMWNYITTPFLFARFRAEEDRAAPRDRRYLAELARKISTLHSYS